MHKLTEIANKHTVDKGTEHYEAHGYTEIYGKYIDDYSKKNLLEIGIWHFDSIRMWNEYNPNLSVAAIDIDGNVYNHVRGGEKCRVYIGNQSDEEFMLRVMDIEKDLDIVIDDGSHNYSDILTTFTIIFPRLKSGSIYFVEDLHAVNSQKDQLITKLFMFNNLDDFKVSEIQFFCGGKLLMIIKK